MRVVRVTVAALAALLVVMAVVYRTVERFTEGSQDPAAADPATGDPAAGDPAAGASTGLAQAAVSGGILPPPGRYPYLCRISPGSGICTGFLIAPRLVMTASHCTGSKQFDGNPAKLTVYVGATSKDDRGEQRGVSRIIYPRPPGEKLQVKETDVAILVLDQASTKPPVLVDGYTTNVTYAVGTPAYIAGFGQNEKQKSGVLRHAMIRITHIDGSRKWFSAQSLRKTPTFQYKHRYGCGGDSGAPIIVRSGGRDVVIGVHTAGKGLMCGDENRTPFEIATKWAFHMLKKKAA
jgi:V8-like Glu-specific endopeptidase